MASALECGSVEGDGKARSYAVLRVTDHSGIVKHEVIVKDKLKERKESLMMRYGAAMKTYRRRKKGMSKKDRDILVQKPSKPTVKIVGICPSQEKAREKANKLQREYVRKRPKTGLFSDK